MTANEIKETSQDGRSQSGWLKEIAYQLALMNEARTPVIAPLEVKRGPGRPKNP